MADEKNTLTLEEKIEQLEMAIFGNTKVNAIGLMKRTSDLEEIVKRWQTMELMMRGALVIMGLTTIANVAAVIKAFLP